MNANLAVRPLNPDELAPMSRDFPPQDIKRIDSLITRANRRDHYLARWGFRRDSHRVEPGLYSLGDPTPESPVFVSANYTLSFDALRSALRSVDAYILVLDTKGVNVWCAAGKGTFGTQELVNRIAATNLDQVVTHRKLILPQLGAAGVSAHEVKKMTGFHVKYGPVRSADLPEYLQTGRATPEMRTVQFKLRDRVVLIPVEVRAALLPMILIAAFLYFAGDMAASAATVMSVVTGFVIFPILLPFVPMKDFTAKGLLLGGLMALPFAWVSYQHHPAAAFWMKLCLPLSILLIFPSITAFMTLTFTGSTTYTSRTGVKREIYTYIPWLALSISAGLILVLVNAAIKIMEIL